MYYLLLLILFMALTSLLFMFIGLVKPWAMLWWEDTQTRLKVIKVYGALTVIFFLLYWILRRAAESEKLLN